MKRLLLALALLSAAFPLRAQEERYDTLEAKLEEYFAALAGEPLSVQNAECDFLIESCRDSLVRQFVTLKIYDHYLRSGIMGDDGVAVHVADTWLIPGKVAMHSDLDLLNAKVFAEFNRQSLLGGQAPVLEMAGPEGEAVSVPVDGAYTLLYFYDTSCSTCRVETERLGRFLAGTDFPVVPVGIYTGSDPAAWAQYRAVSLNLPGIVHLWDPEMASDYARKYGVLQTPRMFLVAPDGTIVGRGLDTPALSLLTAQLSGQDAELPYGSPEGMALYAEIFSGYGDDLKPSDVLTVADYVAERTDGAGNGEMFRQMEGDLLYYLSSQTGEAFKEGTLPFIDRYILGRPEVWASPSDSARVVSLALMMKELLERTPPGSLLPDLKVRGTLLQRPCLFRKGSREGRFSVRKADWLIFYSEGCGRCQETLAAARSLSEGGARVLLVDMDALFTDDPDQALLLLDTFDLSGLPYVLQLDGRGTVLHRYLDFSGK